MRTLPGPAAIAVASRRALRHGALDERARVAAALIAYAALACLAFWPVGPLDAAQLPNGHLGDPVQMTWFLSTTAFALAHGHNPFLTQLIDAPSGVNLAQNTSVPLLGALGAPITLTIGPIAAFNLLVRLAVALSAAAMFTALRSWCRSDAAAFVGGLCYGFCPYVAAHLQGNGHLNLIFVPLPPLLALLVAELAVRQEHRAGRVGALLGLLALAQLLISPEVLSDCVLLAGGFLVVVALVRPTRARAHLSHVAHGVAVAVATFVVLGAVPLYYLAFGPQHLRAPVQPVAQLQAFHADLLQAVIPSPRALVAPPGLQHAFAAMTAPISKGGGGAELGGYLGLPLVLVLIAVLIARRRSPAVLAFAGLGAASYVLSLGSRLEVDGHITAVPLPEAVLSHLPLLDNTVPARFALEVALCAAALLALGLDATIAALAARGGRTRLAGGALGAVVLLAVLAGAAPRLPLSGERPALGAALTAAVRALPQGGRLLTFPYPEPPYDEAMLWQSLDGMRFSLIGGYATVVGPSGASQTWPPLIRPDAVQELLSYAMFHSTARYPAPTVQGPVAAKDLCAFLARYAVSDVAGLSTAAGASGALGLFRTALGAPRELGAGLLLWPVSGPAGAAPC